MIARPLRADEYDAWYAAGRAAYAGDMVGGGLDEDEARAQAEADYESLLPAGLDTAGHQVLVLEDEPGRRVGTLWFAEQHRGSAASVYLYELGIDEDHRGRGLGRQALALLERLALELGAEVIDLAVFGGNTRALSLYESSGFVVTMRTMRKQLRRDGSG